ncbi:MAG: hypothetical protein NTZ69_15395 [Bacteroidia bacterium]|nr:hypothetical protein [Bacteroidia bacterium]
MSKPPPIATNGFTIIKEFIHGGRIELHAEVDINKNDYKDLISISREFAKMGKAVQILPRLHYKDERYNEIFSNLIGTKYEKKCPDLNIDGYFYEYENFTSPFKKGKIGRMIGQGTKQSSRIIINNNKGCSDRYIKRNIYDRLNIGQVIDEVWLYERGKVRLLTKNKGQ